MSEEREFDARKELLFSKGYHLASKYIICDPELTMAAKAVYCYLRSLCRDEFSHRVFPSVKRMLDDLDMSKKLYYKAREELLNAGIIVIVANKNKGSFDNNTYEFPLQPRKYMVDRTDEPFVKWLPIIRTRGVNAAFGFAPFLLMSYEHLDFKAKVLFVYISAHAKNELENPYAELDPKKIMFHLGIKESSYKKYLAQLKDNGFICIERLREGGEFRSLNKYGIIENGPYAVGIGKKDNSIIPFTSKEFSPKVAKEDTANSPKVVKEDTANSPKVVKEDTVNPPTPKKEDTVNPPTPKKEDTVAPPKVASGDTVQGEAAQGEAVKDDTTNTSSSTITSSTNTSNNQIYLDGLIKLVRQKINYRYFEIVSEFTPQIKTVIDALVDTIVQVLASMNPMTIINGHPLLTNTVREELLKVNELAAMNVLNRCLAKLDSIGNLKAYLLPSIYNEILVPTKEDDYEEA